MCALHGWVTETGESVHLSLHNDLGGLTLSARSWVDVASELRIAGRPIAELYVSQASFTQALAAKVNAVEGKGLSTEDFTTEYRRKLDAIVAGSLMEGSAGFATTEDVSRALGGKLNCADNLADLADKAAARNVLEVYSSSECDGRFLQTKKLPRGVRIPYGCRSRRQEPRGDHCPGSRSVSSGLARTSTPNAGAQGI